MGSVALALLGARRTWFRQPSAPAPRARKSARRPAIFATSPTLHLRRHYPHMTSRAGGSAEYAAAVVHSCSHLPQGLIHDPVASACIYSQRTEPKIASV